MSYDLAISPSGDLVFAANKDLLGASGFAQVEQRIRLRLKIRRGSWVFDETRTLGSRLDLALRSLTANTISLVTTYVHEALDDMDDIQITKVEVLENPDDASTVIILVGYAPAAAVDQAPFIQPDEQPQDVAITFQL